MRVLLLLPLQQIAQINSPRRLPEPLILADLFEVVKHLIALLRWQQHQHARHPTVPVVALLVVI